MSMPILLTLGDPVTVGVTDPLRQPGQYEVLGLPPGHSRVLIRERRPGGRWRISRRPNQWEGDYETAEEALAALQGGLGRFGRPVIG
jgi:hypothetical protein